MNKHRKKLTALVGAVAIALTLGACATPEVEEDTGPIELRFSWWGTDLRHELTNEALDLFEEQNPNITVVRDFGGFQGYLEKITTQYTGGNPPDVIQLYNEVLLEFASRGQLYDLNKAVDAGDLSLEGWPEDVVETNTVDGALSALTFGLSTHGLLFDKTKSEELGIDLPSDDYTWDDLKTYADAITAASGGATYGFTDLANNYQAFEVWAKQQGEGYLDTDGIAFSEDTLTEYWEYWADLQTSGGATPAQISAEYPASFEAVTAGVAASTFIVANQFGAVQGGTPNELVLTRMPSESQTPGQYLRAAMNLVVSSQTEHPEAAAKLVDFLLNNEDANRILGIDRGVPANASMVDTATVDADEVNQAAIGLIEAVREDGSPAPVPAPPGSGAVNTLFAEYGQQVQFGQLTPEDAAKQFIAAAQSELG